MAVRVKMQMLSLLSYVHLLNCEGTVLSRSEGTSDKGTEATKGNGKWIGSGAQLRRSR
ncbi:hypothetical protein Csa_004346 [Cucumis sativus]|uniref:Uncharacterized protein n=1 Tax=Cucumis sativus TaxID=3659 RepID=A0A0A0KDN2_CUCSA|nr:hypothetical protein Csa_004346 [Cucumis sativus]